MPLTTWVPYKNCSYQVLHFLGATALVLAVPYGGLDAWWGVLGILVYGIGKEFWADTNQTPLFNWLPLAGWLEDDSLYGSTVDFSFYVIGALLARLTVAYFWSGLVLGLLVLLGLALYDWAEQRHSEYD